MRERFQLDSADPILPRNDKSLEELIPAVIKRMGREQDYWVKDLEKRWTEVAGAAVAQATRPGLYERKQLTVYVNHSMWLMELERNGKQQLLENLQEAFGADNIRNVRFQLDPDGKI